MVLNRKDLPNYVFNKEYKYFLLFFSDTIISEEKNSLKEWFHNLLLKCQKNEIVSIINSNVHEMRELDYSKYDEIIAYYYRIKSYSKIYEITESPDIRLLSHNKKWEYYSNTIYNLSILGFDKDCKEIIDCNLYNDEISKFMYKDWNDYYIKNRQMFEHFPGFLNQISSNYKSIHSLAGWHETED